MNNDSKRKQLFLEIENADPAVLDGLRVARAMSKMSATERRRIVLLAEELVAGKES